MTMEEEYISEIGMDVDISKEQKALLIGFYRGSKEIPLCEEYLSELADLADTFGVSTALKLPCPVRKIEAATYLHHGKLTEIKNKIQELHATLVIIDEEISPAQQRNLEKFLSVPVMDRTELILEIFSQRAQTKEARLQIELAKTKYQFPRLKRMWGHFSRQRAKGGYLKGEGEKQIEIDRRLLSKKIEKLTQELFEVKKYRQTQRAARIRSGIPTFAIIGYTNAGKSTLLNALTEAGVFVEDKLFATLDPTTRKFTLPNSQEILLTDTVGFIRKLPHTLIAAFRSTLEEALYDDVLLHVIDASHPMAKEHALTCHTLLKELGVEERPIITVLNKIDQCTHYANIDWLRCHFPKTVLISALHRQGFEDLLSLMNQELTHRRKTVKLRIPQKEYALVGKLHREGKVHYEEYEEDEVIIKADIPLDLLPSLKKYIYSTDE